MVDYNFNTPDGWEYSLDEGDHWYMNKNREVGVGIHDTSGDRRDVILYEIRGWNGDEPTVSQYERWSFTNEENAVEAAAEIISDADQADYLNFFDNRIYG